MKMVRVNASLLSVIIAFCISWPTIYILDVRFNNIINGSEYDATFSFMQMLAVSSICIVSLLAIANVFRKA